MYHIVLVPLDGSQRAEAILPHVHNLAKRYDATVILLQVVEPIPYTVGLEMAYVSLDQDIQELTKRAECYLENLQKQFEAKGIQARIRVVSGPVVDAIIKAAERESADLIAFASHGRSGLSQVFYGSVAAGLLHRVDRPLLLIRSREGE